MANVIVGSLAVAFSLVLGTRLVAPSGASPTTPYSTNGDKIIQARQLVRTVRQAALLKMRTERKATLLKLGANYLKNRKRYYAITFLDPAFDYQYQEEGKPDLYLTYHTAGDYTEEDACLIPKHLLRYPPNPAWCRAQGTYPQYSSIVYQKEYTGMTTKHKERLYAVSPYFSTRYPFHWPNVNHPTVKLAIQDYYQISNVVMKRVPWKELASPRTFTLGKTRMGRKENLEFFIQYDPDKPAFDINPRLLSTKSVKRDVRAKKFRVDHPDKPQTAKGLKFYRVYPMLMVDPCLSDPTCKGLFNDYHRTSDNHILFFGVECIRLPKRLFSGETVLKPCAEDYDKVTVPVPEKERNPESYM